jgi:hypothetical protein
VTGTEIFGSYKASEILLLKKKNPGDNISKDLVISGYTLETIPSLQTCKEENLIVHSKNVHTIYFAVDSVTLFKADTGKIDVPSNDMVNINDMFNVSKDALAAQRVQEDVEERTFIRLRRIGFAVIALGCSYFLHVA